MLAESISRMHPNQALRCMAGTSAEKFKALEHPYPGTMDKINKFGYDPKQLHHILRLNDFMKRFIAGESYDKCSLTEARRLAYEIDQENKKLKEDNIQVPEYIDFEVEEKLTTLKVKFIKQFLREELTCGE